MTQIRFLDHTRSPDLPRMASQVRAQSRYHNHNYSLNHKYNCMMMLKMRWRRKPSVVQTRSKTGNELESEVLSSETVQRPSLCIRAYLGRRISTVLSQMISCVFVPAFLHTFSCWIYMNVLGFFEFVSNRRKMKLQLHLAWQKSIVTTRYTNARNDFG